MPSVSDLQTMSCITPGTYIARDLIEAKRRGESFTGTQLADRIDVLLEAYNQTAPQPAIPATLEAETPRTLIPPPHEAVTAYFQSIGYPVSGEEFCDSYQQKGWLVGKAKMKDWQSACRNWKRNGWGKPTSAPTATKARDYSRL